MIESMTPAQDAKMQLYRDKGLKIGLSTKAIDFNKTKALVKRAFKAVSLAAPKHIIYAPDCKSAFYMVSYAQKAYPCNGPSAGNARLQAELNKHSNDASNPRATGFDAYWCQADAGWLVWGQFHETVLGVKMEHVNLKLERELIGACYALYLWAGLAVVVDRLKTICLEGTTLHCEDGPALEGRGALKEWFFRGVKVTEQIIMAPKTLTIEQIKTENNEEVRRVMIERFGAMEYMEAIGAEVLDSTPWRGKAERILLQANDGSKWLLCSDGSSGEVYVLPAPRTANTTREAHELLQGGVSEDNQLAEA